MEPKLSYTLAQMNRAGGWLDMLTEDIAYHSHSCWKLEVEVEVDIVTTVEAVVGTKEEQVVGMFEGQEAEVGRIEVVVVLEIESQ
jgi:hypothetical protein